jgi:glycosyltransferase involved in cell wall biosynthesis
VTEPPEVELTVLLPVRNEVANLRIMLKILHAVIEHPYEALVIVDSSSDTSVPVVEEMQKRDPSCRLVVNDRGRGVPNAVRAGVAAARGKYVLIFAADEVGPVIAIDEMLALMREGCDFVSCTRYALGGRRLGGSIPGRILSWLACRLFRFAGGAFSDSTTGIKLFRKDIFDTLGIESPPVGWCFAFEMAIKAQLHGLTLGEVPIISVDRLYGGTSTFRLGPWLVHYMRWFLWGVRHTRQLRRIKRRDVRTRIPKWE